MLNEIQDSKIWNDLIKNNLPRSGGFLGSWEWGEFQKSVGRPIYRFQLDNGFAQVIEHNLPMGKKYWYLPRGSSFGDQLLDQARKNKVIFIRHESISKGVKTIHVSPSTTLILNLEKIEDVLLGEMHEKTRYNVRLASRKGVSCAKSEEFEYFWKLMEETAKRDGFKIHPKLYYEKMLEISFVELWVAKHEGKILAAGIWSFFGDTFTYLHGASSSENRNLMAPYLLHWEVIKNAKSRGFKFYDFWGVCSSKNTPSLDGRGQGEGDSWSGITRFKKGFGGEVVEYPGTHDLPISKFWYSVYKLARKIRRF